MENPNNITRRLAADMTEIQRLGQNLTDDRLRDDGKLSAIENLKKVFAANSSTSLGNVKLESLLTISSHQQINVSKTFEKDFLLNYGTSLIDFFGRDASLDPKLLTQLEFVLLELEKHDENLQFALFKYLWRRFEGNSNFHFLRKMSGMMNKIAEAFVLDWAEGNVTSEKEIDYFVRISSELPEIFQLVTGLLYQILVKSRGQEKILKLMAEFVASVASICEKERKSFLRLYQADCRRLASLLMISPGVYPEVERETTKSVGRNAVVELLSENFSKNREKTLMLLSHFPDWLNVFKVYLDDKKVNLGAPR